jgi:hypothetical protein
MFGHGASQIDESKIEKIEKLQVKPGSFEDKLITAMKPHI